MSNLKVGDKVFRFGANRRVYAPDGRGGPIYREHFYEDEIVGETSRSWLVGKSWNEVKINKKTLEGIYTAEQVDEECWIVEHRHHLSILVQACRDYSKLRRIAEILEVTT